MLLVGIDAGGTFTDFIVYDGRGVRTHKVFSSRGDPAGAVMKGLAELGLRNPVIVHGCTIATNALLERKGAKVALVTTKGFEDLIDIGRQTRSRLYDLSWVKPPPLVAPGLRIGIGERTGPDGSILRSLPSLSRLRSKLRRADAVAICFLHSYANPAHEAKVERALRGMGKPVSRSSAIIPEYREYERLSTTVLNAYVQPVMKGYLDRLQGRISGTLRIMSSAGGQMPVREAAERPVHTLLSGPAGGAIAVEALARSAGIRRILSIDIGGTSADVALYDGTLSVTKEGSIGGFPVRVPILEIHTIGAGGGSIARIDEAGALKVGPESAGAEPGPACYGRGGRRPTVTDANVVLGRISPRLFFGGRLKLDVDASRRALRTLGRDPRRAAEAVLDVVDTNMERALRVVSVERGHDPSGFVLVPFGGAGPLHACSLAERLQLKSILVPRWPGLFSALGMVLADELHEVSRTVLGRDVGRAFRELEPSRADRVERFVDARYRGQSHEIRTPWSGDAGAFHGLHHRRYGFSRDEDPEIVNVVVRWTNFRPKPRWPAMARRRGPAFTFRSGVQRRDDLRAGDRFAGPCVVMEESASTWIARGWKGVVDPKGNLRLWR